MNKGISSCAFASTLVVTFAAVANAANLVANGDFNAGNSGFSSDYQYTDSLFPILEGVYTVGTNPRSVIDTNPSSVHYMRSSFGDHTTGTGNMMIVNGNSQLGQEIWSQTITVTPNTDYNFSTWIASVFPILTAKLQFSINSDLIGQIFIPSAIPGVWEQFNTIWNSGSNESATISIVNQNTLLGIGNDFALDDISFESISAPKPTSVPESSSPLALLATSVFGVNLLVKRKRQQQVLSSSLK